MPLEGRINRRVRLRQRNGISKKKTADVEIILDSIAETNQMTENDKSITQVLKNKEASLPNGGSGDKDSSKKAVPLVVAKRSTLVSRRIKKLKKSSSESSKNSEETTSEASSAAIVDSFNAIAEDALAKFNRNDRSETIKESDTPTMSVIEDAPTLSVHEDTEHSFSTDTEIVVVKDVIAVDITKKAGETKSDSTDAEIINDTNDQVIYLGSEIANLGKRKISSHENNEEIKKPRLLTTVIDDVTNSDCPNEASLDVAKSKQSSLKQRCVIL